MKKQASNIIDNIKWFIKWRNVFNFSGSSAFFLKRVLCYKRSVVGGAWEYMNTISESSFISAFGSLTPNTIYRGKDHEWRLEIEVEDCVLYHPNGVDGIEAFVQIDSYGVVRATRHPALLFSLLQAKASLNLHIKMYAEDRANGRLPRILFDAIAKEFEFKEWMINAVENQKTQYYKIEDNASNKDNK